MGIWPFKADGTRLVATLLGIPGERTLVGIGAREFATADGSFKARFDVPARAVEVREYGRPGTNFVRVQLYPPKNLGDYAGRYVCDELDQTYEIAVVHDRLAVLSPKAAATKLSPTIADSFTGFGNYFFFQRKDGAVSGLILGENTGRVRNLALKREVDK
jgi:hypothetical protein